MTDDRCKIKAERVKKTHASRCAGRADTEFFSKVEFQTRKSSFGGRSYSSVLQMVLNSMK